ncbi:hypothetical protein HH110_04395 [Stenotrophomonas sp. SAM-B]|uniref:hypothetical protein n=1 Tax=Stenotrophomonas sp. SAM-B TaxID=2729141 RepID=UPI0015A09787|nr:hypothetical protein [Stenotrophomonas sp. SAM-B]NWF32287.1 hypothetical protein [Stenotrophomonas sp. SAM-B]
MMIGLFTITRYDAVLNAVGGVERVTSLTVECGLCHATTTSDYETLVHLPGGTLVSCEHCGTHQAVSNFKVAEWGRVAPART